MSLLHLSKCTVLDAGGYFSRAVARQVASGLKLSEGGNLQDRTGLVGITQQVDLDFPCAEVQCDCVTRMSILSQFMEIWPKRHRQGCTPFA